MARGVNVGELLTTFILIVIALALTPTVADACAETVASGNVTGTTATILGLVPMFWVLIILSIGAAKVYSQFKEIEK